MNPPIDLRAIATTRLCAAQGMLSAAWHRIGVSGALSEAMLEHMRCMTDMDAVHLFAMELGE